MTASTLESALASLKDVAGVEGSFLLDREGAPLARDLPSYVGDDVLGEAGLRVARLSEALDAADAGGAVTMRCGDQKLHLRGIARGHLCVLSTTTVNMPALKMALSLVSRRLDAALEAAPSRSASSPSVPPPTVSPAAPAPPAPARKTQRKRIYRGQLLDD